MKFSFILGIDIAKATLDCTLLCNGEKTLYQSIKNKHLEIKKFIIKIHQDNKISIGDMLVVMEFTGTYNDHLVDVLEEFNIPLWQCSSLHISKSGGLQRGKNDEIDSFRIALFALRNIDQYRPHIPVRQEVKQLKRLFAIRRNLVKTRKQIEGLTKDYDFLSPKVINAEKQPILSSIKALDKQICVIEDQMKTIVFNDPLLLKYYTQMTSVRGISFVTTLKILISTNEFKKIDNAKSLACQAGIAPFSHSSGTSIKKKDRISPIADKELKSLLHMAAIAAISHPGELRDYYVRKVDEGKHKMTVINNVRNKLVNRIFACINNNRIYQKNFNKCLVET